MLLFITVGSTRFDALVQRAFSEELLAALHCKGYTKIVLQCGNSSFAHEAALKDGGAAHMEKDGLEIEYWRFRPELHDEYRRADLVLSHAGSGTILDVLRLGKPLLVVPNPTLLDNHQEDLASALSDLGHLRTCAVIDLPKAIEMFDASTLEPFPPFDGSHFAKMLDEEMRFIV